MLNCLIRFFEFIIYLEIEFFERGFFFVKFYHIDVDSIFSFFYDCINYRCEIVLPFFFEVSYRIRKFGD